MDELPVKTKIKASIKKIVLYLGKLIRRTRIGQELNEQMINDTMNQTVQVHHNGLPLRFITPNQINHYRIKSFSTKEPETLEWIDNICEGSVFWDIGANVGLYSIYAAKKKHCQVYAFEPSVFNLELLARNVYLNNLSEKICLVPLSLSDKLSINQFNMTTTEWGGALSTFGRDIGWDGRAIKKVFAFKTLGLSMMDAVHSLKLPQPDYIKMDVDGIEHFILRGGHTVLKNINSILVEINDDFPEQAEQSEKILQEAGLVLRIKAHSEMIGNSVGGFQKTFNQIWVRA